MDLFLEAYSSIQLAFRSELAEIQRSVGVEMMANMAAEFIRRSMISPMEQSYWATLLVLQNVQTEYDQLKLDLSAPGGALAWIKRLRWRTRQNQLRAALVELERRLAAIERQIDFVEVPRARKTNWTA
jgi:chitinase